MSVYRVHLKWSVDVEADTEEKAEDEAKKELRGHLRMDGPADCYSVEVLEETCFVCKKPVENLANDDEAETPICDKCGRTFHLQCDPGIRRDEFLYCTKCGERYTVSK